MSFDIKYDKDGAAINPGNPFEATANASAQQEPVHVIEPEVDPEEHSEDTIEAIEATEEVQEVAPAPEPTYQKQNFRTLREEKAKADKERDEAIIKLKAYEMQLQMQQQQTQQRSPIIPDPEVDFEFDHDPDEILEAKHVTPLVNEIKRLRQEVKQTQQRSTQMTEEAKLLAKYPDYYSIVSQDNINRLQAEDPELAQVLGTSTDIYGAKAMAYKAIKKMNTPKEQPTYDLEKALIQKNAAKPKPLASLSPQQGDSPLSRANAFANGLTPELKKQMWRETQESIKRG